MTAPKGMLTRAVGRIFTLARNQLCWMNSLAWKGRRGCWPMTSAPALALGVEELPDHRLLAGQQHLARAEHRQVLVVEQADVVGHRAGGVHVVGDDEERRRDRRVEIDDQLVEVRRADRVEAGVRL